MSDEAALLRVARLPRRLLGMSVDVTCAMVPVIVMLRADVLSRAAFNPEPGWFYSEWLLRLWLDHPPVITAPLLWWGIFALIWQLVWELALGRTPGAWLAGVSALDVRTGDRIAWWQACVRVVGSGLNLGTLGLGYALCFISREGRALHELISLSVTARPS
jgi:hypothetical protein